MKKERILNLSLYALDAILATFITIRTVNANNAVQNIPEQKQENWTLISDEVTATVYNACTAQCNADFIHTACMYEIDMGNIHNLRVLAMERTMMSKYGISYGDIVRIEGAGRLNGDWQVLDTMSKKYAGQEKIDFLMPSYIRHGKWKNVRISVPADEYTRLAATRKLNEINKYKRI